MGDTLHERAIVRQLMESWDVWLETSWPSIFHDLVGERLHLRRKLTALRTQAKNQDRESDKFERAIPPPSTRAIRLHYIGGQAAKMQSQTVLEAMMASAGCGLQYERADYRLPVPPEWFERLPSLPDRPILVYRPLCCRPEWRGSMVRNADPATYAALLAAIRERYYIVSVADLVPGKEWIVGPEPDADLKFHHGELSFEMLAALFARADLAFTSAGFGAILAPAVGTPVVSILGGYEHAAWLSSAAKFVPYLGIDPIRPCACAISGCHRHCDKRINLPTATARLLEFVGGLS